jgi:hypothetical protein
MECQVLYKDIFAETAMFEWPSEGLLVNGEKSIFRQGSWAEYQLDFLFINSTAVTIVGCSATSSVSWP